jgi:uncharacterized membrane protein
MIQEKVYNIFFNLLFELICIENILMAHFSIRVDHDILISLIIIKLITID